MKKQICIKMIELSNFIFDHCNNPDNFFQQKLFVFQKFLYRIALKNYPELSELLF